MGGCAFKAPSDDRKKFQIDKVLIKRRFFRLTLIYTNDILVLVDVRIRKLVKWGTVA